MHAEAQIGNSLFLLKPPGSNLLKVQTPTISKVFPLFGSGTMIDSITLKIMLT